MYKVKLTRWSWIAFGLLLMLSACNLLKTAHPEKMKYKSSTEVKKIAPDIQQLSIVHLNGDSYVPLRDLVTAMHYRSKWNPSDQTFVIGEHDVSYRVRMGSAQAMKAGTTVKLPKAPQLIGGAPYVTLSSVPVLFGDELHYTMKDQRLYVSPVVGSQSATGDSQDGIRAKAVGDSFFSDDPTDPFKENILTSDETSMSFPSGSNFFSSALNDEAVPAVQNVNTTEIIRTAKRYLGVKYDFGTDPYQQSGKFDCSSFTQYIYDKYGVSLDRVARAQAMQGDSVSRSSLRRGDLLFFSVPGRFKSDNMVGHVGIYIGNKYMIHASPEPKNGVQISYINKPFWKENFLKARRVVNISSRS